MEAIIIGIVQGRWSPEVSGLYWMIMFPVTWEDLNKLL